MKRGTLMILWAIFFSLSLVSPETLAKNSGNVTVMDKPDLIISDVMAPDKDTVKFSVVSHNYTVPANTITVLIWAYPDNPKQIYDFDWKHEVLIEETISAEVVKLFSIKLPSDKSLAGKKQYAVMVDFTNKVDESDEKNNFAVKDVPPFSSPFPDMMDFKFNDTLYFTPKGTNMVRTGKPGAPLKISKGQTNGCEGGKCQAALTVRARKTPGKTVLPYSLDVLMTNTSTGEQRYGSVKFDLNEGIKDATITIGLQEGENKLKIDLDSAKHVGESDDNNNSFEVTVILIPD